MAKKKRRLTQSEEFEIMKLVLDKFLWLGVVIMGYGLWLTIANVAADGLYYIIGGAVILGLFAWFIVSEFERIR